MRRMQPEGGRGAKRVKRAAVLVSVEEECKRTALKHIGFRTTGLSRLLLTGMVHFTFIAISTFKYDKAQLGLFSEHPMVRATKTHKKKRTSTHEN